MSNKNATYEEEVSASARLTGRQLLSVSWNVWPFFCQFLFLLTRTIESWLSGRPGAACVCVCACLCVLCNGGVVHLIYMIHVCRCGVGVEFICLSIFS
jgi:hypothetical protein